MKLFSYFGAFIVVATLAMCSSITSAQITYLSQTRVVRVQGGFPFSSIGESAPDFAVFDSMVSASLANPVGVPPSTGSASQFSLLDPSQIRMRGAVEGRNEYSGGGSGGGFGVSSLDVSFSIDSSMPFTLSGTFAFPISSPWNNYRIRLSGPTGVLVNYNLSTNPTTLPFNSTGTLTAGDHRLEIFYIGGYQGTVIGSGSATFDIALAIPAPAGVAAFAGAAALGSRRRRSGR